MIPRLVSSRRGGIDLLFLTLPAQLVDTEPALAERLIADVAPQAALVAVTHARTASRVRSLAAGRRSLALAACPDEAPLTVWSQDTVLAYDAGAGPAIAAAALPGAPGPAGTVASALLRSGLVAVAPDPVPVRGGNLLADDAAVLVGADEWRRLAETDPDDPLASHRLFRTRIDASRPPLVLAGGSGRGPGPSRGFTGPDGAPWREEIEPGIVERASRQPIYHLDLYAALAGPDATGRPVVVIGDIRQAAALAGTDAPADRAGELDTVASWLAAAGWRVERCPLPLVAVDDPVRRRRRRIFASPLNALVEDGGPGRRRIWIPELGVLAGTDLRAVDAAAAALWRRLGYEVLAVPGLGPLMLRAGGLHCAVKILRRET